MIAGDSFLYLYTPTGRIYDVEGRPEAFFALTVSFHKSHCTNVYKLFQLLLKPFIARYVSARFYSSRKILNVSLSQILRQHVRELRCHRR